MASCVRRISTSSGATLGCIGRWADYTGFEVHCIEMFAITTVVVAWHSVAMIRGAKAASAVLTVGLNSSFLAWRLVAIVLL